MKDSLNNAAVEVQNVLQQGSEMVQNTGFDFNKLPLYIIDWATTILALYVIGKILWHIGKGEDPKAMLMKNPYKAFNSLAVISCLVEVVTLTVAATLRGISFSSAIAGYVVFAIVEVVTVFWVMEEVSKIFADRQITLKDWKAGVRAMFAMFISFCVTTFIFFLYRESVGAVGILSSVSVGWWDFWGVAFDVDQSVALEARSTGMIYSTQFFMLMGILFEYKRLIGGGGNVAATHVPGNVNASINNRSTRSTSSSRSNSSSAGTSREDELQDLIANSVGIPRQTFQAELDEIQGN